MCLQTCRRLFHGAVSFIFLSKYIKNSLGAIVKLLLCDLVVTILSCRNSLLYCRVKLHIKDSMWFDPSPRPVLGGVSCTRLPFLSKYAKNIIPLSLYIYMIQFVFIFWYLTNFKFPNYLEYVKFHLLNWPFKYLAQ